MAVSARRGWLVFAAVFVMVAAGCSSGSPAESTPTPSTTSSASSSPDPTPDPSAIASAAALAAYADFRTAQVKALASLDVQASGLARYAIDKAFAGVAETVLLFQQQGIVMKGQPTSTPSVDSVSLTASPSAVVVDCFDTSRWEAVYQATGKSAVAPGQNRRTTVHATAEVYDGRWVIRTVTNEKDRTC